MTLINLPQPFFWPQNLDGSVSNSLSGFLTLDLDTEYWGFTAVAPEDMTITRIGWRTNAITGNPNCDFRIETVDPATGGATGTLWATGTNVTANGLANTTSYTFTLTNSATILKGQQFAMIVRANGTGGFGASNILTMPAGTGPWPSIRGGQASVRITNTSGSLVRSVPTGPLPICAIGTTSKWYWFSGVNGGALDSTLSSTNSGANQRVAQRIRVPFKCKVGGLLVLNESANDGEHFTAGIYDDSYGSIVSKSFTNTTDSNLRGGVIPKFSGTGMYIPFDSEITLNKDTWYRPFFQSDTAGVSSITVWGVNSPHDLTWFRNGQHLGRYSTWNGSAWTEVSTDSVAGIDLEITAIDDGDGAGGGGPSPYSYASFG